MTGTKDFAYDEDLDRTDRMSDSDYFASIKDDPENGNFAFLVKKGYSHDAAAVMDYTWNAVRAFFPGRNGRCRKNQRSCHPTVFSRSSASGR